MLRARSYRFRKLSARPSHGQTMTARNRMAVNSALLTDAQNQIRSSGHLDQRIWRIPGFFLFPKGLSPQRYGDKADPSRVALRIGGSDAGFVLRRTGKTYWKWHGRMHGAASVVMGPSLRGDDNGETCETASIHDPEARQREALGRMVLVDTDHLLAHVEDVLRRSCTDQR